MSATYEFIFWTVLLFALVIVLLFAVHWFRRAMFARNLESEGTGMSFDTVADMVKKGWLSPEEAQRVKSALARHYSRLYAPTEGDEAGGETGGAAGELLPDDVLTALGEAKPSKPPSVWSRKETAPTETAGPPAAKSPQQPPTTASRSAQSPQRAGTTQTPAPKDTPEVSPESETGDVPLDVMDMYRMGMISADELQALRRFYAARRNKEK
jgi:hypothetical protein